MLSIVGAVGESLVSVADRSWSYGDVEGWRAYQPLLPPDLRVEGDRTPTEERLDVAGCSVHLDRWSLPDAPLTVVAVHGGGGHGRMMAPLCLLARAAGCEAVAPDLPLYGLTHVPDPGVVRYSTWIDVVSHIVEREARQRPVVLFGASMGGRLAYDVAARTRLPVGVIATCLLDPRDPRVRRAVARDSVSARLVPAARRLPARLLQVKVPMRLVARMSAMSNTPALARACARDAQGGGTRAPLAFLLDWLDSAPTVEPEDFDVCPVLLVHPREDRWTPPTLSTAFLDRVRAPHTTVLLDGAGHFPIEQPGLDQLRSAFTAFLAALASDQAGGRRTP